MPPRTLLFLALCIPSVGPLAVILLIELFHWLYKHVPLPRPTQLPVRNLAGTVILTYDDWVRHARDLYPIRFFVFETVPRLCRRGVKAVSDVLYLIGDAI